MGCFPVSSRQMLMAHMVAITEKNNVIESVFLPEFASYPSSSKETHSSYEEASTYFKLETPLTIDGLIGTNASMANGSSTNNTESPCDIFKMGGDTCYPSKSFLDSFGHPASLSCAVVGIFLNVVVIFILRHAIKKRRKPGKIHLLTLAFADLAFVIGCFNQGVASWLCNPCLPCSQLGHCYTALRVVAFLLGIAVNTNRWLILVITWLRARAIKNPFLQHANRDQSLRQSMTELIGYTLLFFGIHTAVSEIVKYFLIQNGVSPPRIELGYYIVDTCLAIVIMLAFATYILVKLRQRNNDAGNNISHAEADFQRLVALVALVFVLTHVVVLANFVVSFQNLPQPSGVLRIFCIRGCLSVCSSIDLLVSWSIDPLVSWSIYPTACLSINLSNTS